MKILILGAGKMGSFFIDLLSFDHEVAVYDIDPQRLRFTYNCRRFTSLDEIDAFAPELVINAVSLKHTLDVFRQVIPHLPSSCILSDISSVKTGFKEFYDESGGTLFLQGTILPSRASYLRIHIRRARPHRSLLSLHSVHLHLRFCSRDEAPRCSGNHFQTPHAHCPRCTERG